MGPSRGSYALFSGQGFVFGETCSFYPCFFIYTFAFFIGNASFDENTAVTYGKRRGVLERSPRVEHAIPRCQHLPSHLSGAIRRRRAKKVTFNRVSLHIRSRYGVRIYKLPGSKKMLYPTHSCRISSPGFVKIRNRTTYQRGFIARVGVSLRRVYPSQATIFPCWIHFLSSNVNPAMCLREEVITAATTITPTRRKTVY